MRAYASIVRGFRTDDLDKQGVREYGRPSKYGVTWSMLKKKMRRYWNKRARQTLQREQEQEEA